MNVNLFGNSIFAGVIKMRLHWSRVFYDRCHKNRRETQRKTYKHRRMPEEDMDTQKGHVIMKVDRDWSNTGPNQETPKTAVNHQKLRENRILLT